MSWIIFIVHLLVKLIIIIITGCLAIGILELMLSLIHFVKQSVKQYKRNLSYKKEIRNVVESILSNKLTDVTYNRQTNIIEVVYMVDLRLMNVGYKFNISKKNHVICDNIKVRISKIEYEELLLKVL
jgi:hypothetical protein